MSTLSTIKLTVEMTAERDGTYSVSVNNDSDGVAEDSDAQYGPGGISEGYVTDYCEIAHEAGELVKRFLTDNGWRIDRECQGLDVTNWDENPTRLPESWNRHSDGETVQV